MKFAEDGINTGQVIPFPVKASHKPAYLRPPTKHATGDVDQLWEFVQKAYAMHQDDPNPITRRVLAEALNDWRNASRNGGVQ